MYSIISQKYYSINIIIIMILITNDDSTLCNMINTFYKYLKVFKISNIFLVFSFSQERS